MGTSTVAQALLGISPDDANTSCCKQTSTDKRAQAADKSCEVFNPCTHGNINKDSLSHMHTHINTVFPHPVACWVFAATRTPDSVGEYYCSLKIEAYMKQ